MRAPKSITGAVLVAIYLSTVAAAWIDYSRHPHEMLADLWLWLLTSPFVLLVWATDISGAGSPVRAGEPTVLVVAVAFCAALLYFAGAGLGWAANRLRGSLR